MRGLEVGVPRMPVSRPNRRKKRKDRSRKPGQPRPIGRDAFLRTLARSFERLGEGSLQTLVPLRAGCAHLERLGLAAWAGSTFRAHDLQAVSARVRAQQLPPEGLLAAMALIAHEAPPPASAQPAIVTLADGRTVRLSDASPAHAANLFELEPDEAEEGLTGLEAMGLLIPLHQAGEAPIYGTPVEPDEVEDWGIDPSSLPRQADGESIHAFMERCGLAFGPPDPPNVP